MSLHILVLLDLTSSEPETHKGCSNHPTHHNAHEDVCGKIKPAGDENTLVKQKNGYFDHAINKVAQEDV